MKLNRTKDLFIFEGVTAEVSIGDARFVGHAVYRGTPIKWEAVPTPKGYNIDIQSSERVSAWAGPTLNLLLEVEAAILRH